MSQSAFKQPTTQIAEVELQLTPTAHSNDFKEPEYTVIAFDPSDIRDLLPDICMESESTLKRSNIN